MSIALPLMQFENLFWKTEAHRAEDFSPQSKCAGVID